MNSIVIITSKDLAIDNSKKIISPIDCYQIL